MGSGRSIAASWYVSDLPDPVGMSASVSRPAIAARTTSSCPGRKASKPKSSRSGEARSVRRASIGIASGGLCADFAPISAPADARSCEVVGSRGQAVVGELVPVGRLVRVRVRHRCGGPSARRACPRRCRRARRRRPARRGSIRTRRRIPAARARSLSGLSIQRSAFALDHEILGVSGRERAERCRSSAGTRRSGRWRCRAAARAPRRSRPRTGSARRARCST